MTKDKRVVIGIIFGFIWFSVYSWFPNPEIKDIVRTALGVILCVFLYLGYSWSRWVMGILSALAVVVGVVTLASSSGNMANMSVLVMMLCFYCYAAFYLLNPKLLSSHFKNESA